MMIQAFCKTNVNIVVIQGFLAICVEAMNQPVAVLKQSLEAHQHVFRKCSLLDSSEMLSPKAFL
ncbi:hypothetical protein C2U56_05715 [Pseudomonas fluorescens]|jgi:hypothetical protein|nr:hypothetical protein C2U56_05715 [Pseudomonas fluorescens]